MLILFMTFLVSLILSLFFLGSKSLDNDILKISSFECGFSSYYFNRFSFSIHYFNVGLIFLFLDLEICYLMPFFNLNFYNFKMMFFLSTFILILVGGLIEEWKNSALDWKF